MGATLPRNRLARKLDANEILEVLSYAIAFDFRNFNICGPVNLYFRLEIWDVKG